MRDAQELYEEWKERGAQNLPRALSQSDHERINSLGFPGTRELCCECDEPTGNAGAGDGSLFTDDGEGPFCGPCHDEREKEQ